MEDWQNGEKDIAQDLKLSKANGTDARSIHIGKKRERGKL